MPNRHRVPVWLMGLTNLSYGLYGGAIAFAIPQLLGNRQVPEATIAGLTAVAISPGFWAFLFSPVLDVRFSRRFYAAGLAVFASLTLVVAFLSLDHLALLEVVLTVGFFAAYLYQSALGGWLSSITSAEEENLVSVWMTIGNTGGFGLMAVGCNQIVRHLSPLAAALVLAASILVPIIPFPFMQAPGPDRRLASESFPQFFGDLVSLVKRREVLVALDPFRLACRHLLAHQLPRRPRHRLPRFARLHRLHWWRGSGVRRHRRLPDISRPQPPLAASPFLSCRGSCRRRLHALAHSSAARSGLFRHRLNRRESLSMPGHHRLHRHHL